ncbi:MAG: bifunctional adenosylcobinamide kinase/adenosylcobinamide-phosphate guanylyltransferase [Acidimicrobiales bacterium]|nr:bifunctional adenosylcobinamide kinase/adenosylcobinamide-phosphate guanylyltransferase [Acidimicrobiales bacterium]
MITLIVGGARSGKSLIAEGLVATLPPPTTYVATAVIDPSDVDFVARVEAHRSASGMRMNRPRTPPSAVLPDLTGPPITASAWRWSAAEPERSGRLLLPPPARRALGIDGDRTTSVSGVVRGDTLVLRTAAADNGRAMTVDGRGRIYLPAWLRRHSSFLVGTHADPDEQAVVVVPDTTPACPRSAPAGRRVGLPFDRASVAARPMGARRHVTRRRSR